MNKAVIMGAGGLLAGVAAAAALFFFVFSGGEAAEALPEEPREPVSVAGRIGPHIVLEDRVFNLMSGTGSIPAYLKLQTLIEFETTDEQWEWVLNGCASTLPVVPQPLVSAVPGGTGAPAVAPPAGGAGGGEDRCTSEEQALLEAFSREIGTGRQLIEDAVTSIVSAQTPEAISTPAGKEALRAEIRDAVNELLGGRHTVTRVLFLNFIQQ
jgi:flagellar basal body-associated protein FliL